jgi:hypothetical protein
VAHDNWYVQWLAQWAYSAFEDSMTRENALRLSLVQQNGR